MPEAALLKIEVLIDRKSGDLSLVSTDDSTGEAVETTLSVEQAWALVAQLNTAIQQLAPTVTKPVDKPVRKRGSDYHHVSNPLAQLDITPGPSRVREAVLEAIGADQVRTQRYSKPGSPSNLPVSGLRG